MIDRETLGDYPTTMYRPVPPSSSPYRKDISVKLSEVIKAYNKFLMYLDHPIQGYVDLFGEKIAYTSFQERCMIEKCRSMITVRSNAIIHSFENTLYEDYSYERFVTDIHNIIMDELNSLNNTLVYKFFSIEITDLSDYTPINMLHYKREIMRQLGVYNFAE